MTCVTTLLVPAWSKLSFKSNPNYVEIPVPSWSTIDGLHYTCHSISDQPSISSTQTPNKLLILITYSRSPIYQSLSALLYCFLLFSLGRIYYARSTLVLSPCNGFFGCVWGSESRNYHTYLGTAILLNVLFESEKAKSKLIVGLNFGMQVAHNSIRGSPTGGYMLSCWHPPGFLY